MLKERVHTQIRIYFIIIYYLYKYTVFSCQVCNVSNTIKLAVDFVSPFNATQMQLNLQRIYEEDDREDYIAIHRTLHKGLTRALQVLQSSLHMKEKVSQAEGKIAEMKVKKAKLVKENYALKDENASLHAVNDGLENTARDLRKEVDDLRERLAALQRYMAINVKV